MSEDSTYRQALRQRMIAQRESLPAAQHSAWSQQVLAQLAHMLAEHDGKVVGFCHPMRGEIDVLGLLARRLAEGRGRAALPIVVAPDAPLAFREWTPATPLLPDRYGIPTPTSGEWLRPDIVLAPVNAFDDRRFRIGYGGGYFDRTLAALNPRPLAIGLGFDFQRVDSIRPQPHDLPLDVVITESGMFC